MKHVCFAITTLLTLATIADAQVVVQQQRGLFRNSSTVAVGAGGVNSNVVVNQQRGLFRNSSTVAVGGGGGADVVVNNSRRSSQVVVGGGGYGYGGATFAQRSFAAPAYYSYQQRQVALAPVASYSYAVQRAVYAAPVIQQQVIQQQVYAAPPVVQQQVYRQKVYAAPPVVQAPCVPVPRAPSCGYVPPHALQQFAPPCASGGCGNGNGGQTYLPAAQNMLDRFGVPGY